MRYETTPRFDSDFKALRREQFIDLMAEFSTACDAYVSDPGAYVWPKTPARGPDDQRQRDVGDELVVRVPGRARNIRVHHRR